MHNKKYKKTERRGLPGGPNEQIIHTDINISTEGYKLGSPDFNNPYNIIPSSYITMVDVPFSVLGTDNLGNSQLMEPGKNYKFPGDKVLEIPMAQDGKEVVQEVVQEQPVDDIESDMSREPGSGFEDIKTQGGWEYKKNVDDAGNAMYYTRRKGSSNWMDLQMKGNEIPLRSTKAEIFGDDKEEWFGTEDQKAHEARQKEEYNKLLKERELEGKEFDDATLANEELSSAYNNSVAESIQQIDTSGYGVKVIQYPIGHKSMPPGHIEAVLYDKETGNIVNEIPDTEFVGYINRWTNEGNRPVDESDYERNGENKEGVRTVDLELPDSDVKNFISTAQLFTPSTRDQIHKRLGLGTSDLPISSGDIYTYDFLESNCADGVCMGLGLNKTQAESAGITDPLITMDNLLTKYGEYAQNVKGDRVSKKEGLSKLLQEANLPEFDNPQTLNTTLNYLDGLERGELVKALEDISKIPTVQRLAKGNLNVSSLDDVSNIVGDAIDAYDALPEGTIPTALKGVHYTYVNPVIKEYTPFDISPQGVDNIIPWWEKQAEEAGDVLEGAWDATKDFFGFQRGGSVSEVWQQVTGTPWSQAKAQGLTDGSYDANINLRKQLLANPEQFKQKQTPAHDLTPANTPSNASNPTLSPEEVNDKINQAKDFNSAFKLARDYYGPNKIFSYKNKQFGTNLRGETFQPSEEDMVTAGLKPKQREAIQEQNRLVVSPYTTTNSVEFDEFEDIEKVKKNTEDLNKLNQVDLIVSYQLTHAKDPYLVVDENMGRMHLYYPGQTEPMESYPILSGSNAGDAQTVTKADYFYKGEKLDQAGLNEAMRSTGAKSVDELMDQPGYSAKTNWDAGNKTTGAGRFTIGIVNEDSGFFDDSGRGRQTPSFVLRNEQGNDVSTVIHTVPSRKSASRINALANFDPENSRMTNGCINGRCSDLIDMNKIHNVGEGTEVFVLPEDEGNKFIFENGQLNFRVNSGEDYNTYTDKEGNEQRGQGINRTINTLKYKPIQIEVDEEQFQSDKFTYFDFNDEEEYKNVVVPYVKSLQDNKQKIMQVMQVNGDVYNDIAKVSFGILGNESNFGDTHSAAGNLVRAGRKWWSPTTSSSPDYQSKFDTYKIQGDDNSVGLTQFRWKWVEEDAKQGGDLKERLATLGITGNRDFLDAEKAALATTAILAYYYNNRKVDDIMNDLPKHYAGQIERDPNRLEYTRNVKDNAKYLTIKEKQYQDGGETIHNVSKGDTFYGIANKYGVSFKDLTNANPDINIQNLSIDQAINIPAIKGDVTEVSKDVATSGLTDALFMRQAYKESTFRPDARSGAGALGLTQIMPNTLSDYKKATGETDVDLTNIDDAIKVQKWAMNDLYNASFINKDNQSPEVRLAKTLASYNWGRGNMVNYLNKKKKAGDDIYNSLDWVKGLPSETKDYIDKILGNNEKFNEEFDKAITNEDNVPVIRGYGQSRGGEIHKELFNIYKNYMNGMYDDTPYFKEGSEVYDKLNRVYYNKAKAKGMSSPNYIMSHIIN